MALVSSNKENTKAFIDFFQPTHMDSGAWSCHATSSLKLLDDDTVQHTNRALVGINGLVLLTLAHNGCRALRTGWGVARFDQVYYADWSNYNLTSVSAMAHSEVKAVLGKKEGRILRRMGTEPTFI